jgi:serine protease Do
LSRKEEIMNTLRRTSIAFCGVGLVVVSGLAVAEADTIELSSGAMVRGEVLAKKADRVVVDLGFQVLEIPIGEVVSITEDTDESTSVNFDHELYQVSSGQEELTVRENMARCAEAVVQVRTPVGLGSGFVIHPDGYVVTNQHVVTGEHKISVTLFKQGETALEHVHFKKVRIVAMNPVVDLALLKIEDSGDHEFQTVPLGSSASLKQGQTVFAVGSPLGLDRSVSQGIISLTSRVIRGRIYTQTTAEINPGNSGGPLFNLRGEVVGINDLKLVGVGLEGLSFAIPANVLMDFLEHRNAFAFDPRNPNSGFIYNEPPGFE